MTNIPEIKKGHFYTLKVEGFRVRVYVKELVGERYAKVKHPDGKIHLCATNQLQSL